MTIIERALELIPNGSRIGLGSGRAAQAFIKALGERTRSGCLHVYGVPTSQETANLAMREDIPLLKLDQAGTLELTVDGADEVDPNLDLIKGYGRALVRERIVAAASRRLIILVGDEKLVPRLGSRGKLPVEVTPFALQLCEQRLRQLGCVPVAYREGQGLFVTENGNHILDCRVEPIADASRLEMEIRAIPGVVGTGLFLGMADTVLIGDRGDFRLIEERRRGGQSIGYSGRGTPSLCSKLNEVPPLLTDWQQPVLCPDCAYYDAGQCINPTRMAGDTGCPFDGLELPLREVTTPPSGARPNGPPAAGPPNLTSNRSRLKTLEQAVRFGVMDRTGKRIQSLAVELADGELVLRGTAPCYHVKQLALHAALEVLDSTFGVTAALRLEVDVVPPAVNAHRILGRG